MPLAHRIAAVLAALAGACLAAGPALAAGELVPRVALETRAGTTELWVAAGSGPRRLVRSAAHIDLERKGGDPSGRTAFVTWREGDGRRWAVYTRDAGASWSEARPVATAIRLRAGAVAPGRPMPPPPAGLALPDSGRVFVVQFRAPGLPEWRRALEAAGAENLAHLPHNAQIVRVDRDRLAALEALSIVERVEPYHPGYRLEQALLDWLGDTAGPDRMRVRVVAFEWGAAGKARIARAARALGAEVAALWPNGQILELLVDRQQLAALAAHDDVEWIDRDSEPEPDMDLVRQDSGAVWLETNHGFTGQGVAGEVLDNGVDESHQDFDGILLHGPHNVLTHGTQSYGVVFGNGDRDGDGDARAVGHLPDAQGIFADYETLGDRFAHTEELKHPPYEAAFQTNSWGNSRTTSYNSFSSEMDDIIFRLDIAILQSQSNAGTQSSRPQAWAKNIISVGGIQHKDTLATSDDCWCSDASIGPAEDGRIKPDLSYWNDAIFTTRPSNGYGNFGGTSAATPEAAGVIGLLAQMWAENVFGTDPVGTTVFDKLPHHSTLKALAINTAEQYAFSGENDDLTRVHQGWGRPNVQNAFERAAKSFIVDWDDPLEMGQSITYEVQVEPNEPELKITMIYPDPAGTTSSTLHRINDVDLKVTSPTGDVYHGNVGLDTGTTSLPGGAPNGVDTVENVFVANPTDGVWTIEVSAVEVNQDGFLDTAVDDVVFSLVVTGATDNTCARPVVDFTITPNPARVGEVVQFDSTVSGGAGPPYSYAWDFDADGITDATEPDPTHVYHRPYNGPVALRVADAESCPERVEKTMTVTGPDLRYEAFVGLTEVEGNGNGGVDPGEIWDVTVQIRNTGDETALGVTADLVVDPATPGPVSVRTGAAAYGDVPVDFVASSVPAYRFQVGQDFPCGQDAVFDLVNIRSVDPDNLYPDEIGVVRILVGGTGPPATVHADGFETDLGWTPTGGGEWEIGPPQGLGGTGGLPGGGTPDPAAAIEGTQVLGNDLSGQGNFLGDYEAAIASTVTSPPIDLTGVTGTTLTFMRWLNVAFGDTATLEVSPDGATWTTLLSDSDGNEDTDWVLASFDVSSIADGSPAFAIRFGITSDGGFQTSGWNVDDLRLDGVTRDSCEPFARALPGEASGLTVTRDGAGGLVLSWAADCAGSTTYGVYRGDLSAGYDSIRPEPGACSVAATSTTVPEGPEPAAFFLVVPNDGGFEGSYGPGRAPSPEACLPTDLVDACAP